jgi:SEL1 protein
LGYLLIAYPQHPPSYYFPSDPVLAYSSFEAHASRTGNASSQAFLAFFHATGYHEVVPVNQAKAQLYYTFAAQSGDKGAQMALGYRYWAGIGSAEDCGRAMQWYEQASHQGECYAIDAINLI